MSAIVHSSTAPLPAMVRAAADALALATTAAEVLDARDNAGAVYDTAKRTARLQRAKAAHDDLLAATYRAQADALEIESMAKRRLADEYDAAQDRGEVATRGKPVNVSDGNIKATAEEIGLTRKQIFESRQMRDVIEREPGIVRSALDHLLASRQEPSRANLRAAIGTASASKEDRGNNLYETPPEAMRTLLALEPFGPLIWEPSCGKGAISRILEDAGHEVILSDLIDYGTATKDGECQTVIDFLATKRTAMDDGIVGIGGTGRPDIATNPPYGESLNAFVAHALKVHRPRKMALLLNGIFLWGFDDADRNFALDECPPARVLVFTRRLPMMHRDGWDGPKASSRMNTAWFIWEQDEHGNYAGPTALRRVDWKDYEEAAALLPSVLTASAASLLPADHASEKSDGSRSAARPAVGALIWKQEYEGGRILAMSGDLEIGAVFPHHKSEAKAKASWAFFLNAVGGLPHTNAKTEDAAKAALTKRWAEFLGKAGLA